MRGLFTIIMILAAAAGQCCLAQGLDPAAAQGGACPKPELDKSMSLLLRMDTAASPRMSVDSTYKYSAVYLRLARELGDNDAESIALYCLGWCYFHQGRFTEAIEAYKESIEADKSDTSALAACYLEMAYCRLSLGDFNEADSCCRAALKLYGAQKDMPRLSESYRFLGIMCTEYNFRDMASEYLRKSYQIDSAWHNNRGLIYDYIQLGRLSFMEYRRSGRNISLLKSALKMMKQSQAIADSSADGLGFCELMERMSEVYLEFSDYSQDEACKIAYADSAIACAGMGCSLAQKYGYYEYWLRLYMNEAQAYICKSEPDSVGEHISYINARYNHSASHRLNLGGKFYQLSANYCKMLGQYQEALEYTSLLRQYNFVRYNFDLGSKINNIQARENYEQLVDELNSISKQRNIEFNEGNERHEIIIRWLIISILLVALVMAGSTINYLALRKQSRKMKKQTRAIAYHNSVLSRQQDEFLQLRKEYISERESLDLKKSQFRKASRSIITSLSHARQMQDVLMPSRTLMNQIFGECLIYWMPLQMVSGDFYWGTQIRDVRVLVAADCTGHGVPGAFLSMLGISSLNNILSPRNVFGGQFSAAFVINEMRHKVMSSLRQYKDDLEQFDSMDMSVVVTRLGDSRIEYAGANRPLLIAGDESMREFQPDYMPAGMDVNSQQKPFTNHVIDCASGDVVYMYSDGITDQFGGKSGRTKFGDRRLKGLLASIHTLPFQEQYSVIKDCVSQWTTQISGDDTLIETYCPQIDDQLLLGIRI